MSPLVKPVTWLLGVVLTLVGIAGFFVEGQLLVFQVDTIHNVVHLLSGVVALWAASSGHAYARLYLIVFGLVYGVVTVLGFATGSIVGLFPVNEADNYLHAGIAAVCLVVGLGSKK